MMKFEMMSIKGALNQWVHFLLKLERNIQEIGKKDMGYRVHKRHRLPFEIHKIGVI